MFPRATSQSIYRDCSEQVDYRSTLGTMAVPEARKPLARIAVRTLGKRAITLSAEYLAKDVITAGLLDGT